MTMATQEELLATAQFPFGKTGLVFSRVFRVEAGEYQGLNFALFTNNVNCIFCHAKIDSVAKYQEENYPAVRVAALDNLLLRSSSADSTIAGKLYARGTLTDKDGTPLDPGRHHSHGLRVR